MLDNKENGVLNYSSNELEEPLIAKVVVNRTPIDVLLAPGSITTIKYSKPINWEFGGDNIAVNTFLSERFNPGIPSSTGNLSLDEFNAYFEKGIANYEKRMNEVAAIEPYHELILNNYRVSLWSARYPRYLGKLDKAQADQAVRDYLSDKTEDSYKYARFRESILEIANWTIFALNPEVDPLNWMEAAMAKINWATKELHTPSMVEHVVHAATHTYISKKGLNGTEDLRAKYNEMVVSENYRTELNELVAKFELIGKGKPVKSFPYVDRDNNPRSLDEFKGKYVYIDIWATWCGPCKAQFPYLKELKKEFKNNNIVFLGFNVDRTKNYFDNFLDKNDLKGEQWWVGYTPEFSDFWQIQGIPRFLLIDPQGQIVEAHMLRPDNPEKLSAYLKELDGI